MARAGGVADDVGVCASEDSLVPLPVLDVVRHRASEELLELLHVVEVVSHLKQLLLIQLLLNHPWANDAAAASFQLVR